MCVEVGGEAQGVTTGKHDVAPQQWHAAVEPRHGRQQLGRAAIGFRPGAGPDSRLC